MKMQAVIANLIKLTGKKISYEEVGKAINTTRQNVGYLVKNNSDVPKDKVDSIEEYFNVDFSNFVLEEEVKNKFPLLDLIGKNLTEKELQQIFQALDNNKALFLLFIEKLNNDPQAVKDFLL